LIENVVKLFSESAIVIDDKHRRHAFAPFQNNPSGEIHSVSLSKPLLHRGLSGSSLVRWYLRV
jgi:hypothetical protein